MISKVMCVHNHKIVNFGSYRIMLSFPVCSYCICSAFEFVYMWYADIPIKKDNIHKIKKHNKMLCCND